MTSSPPIPPSAGSKAVRQAYARGQAALPDVRLEPSEFAADMADGQVSDEALALNAADLFLASACCRGDRAALRAFEHHHLTRLPAHVRRLQLPPDLEDELCQDVRIRLLSGSPPRLRQYTGKGALEAWLRVVAMRAAINMLVARKPDETARDAMALELLVQSGAGIEIEDIRHRYRERVEAAFERGFEALTAREKTVLRMNVIDDMSIDVIGTVFRAHRATVARWLVAIRRKLVGEVRRELKLDLRSTSAEAQSLMRLFEGELRISVGRLLEARPPG